MDLVYDTASAQVIQVVKSERKSRYHSHSQFLQESTLLYCIDGFGFVQDCLNVAVGFLHIHWLQALTSLEIKIELVTCMSALLARSGYFSFSILHTHLLMTADLLLSFSGF